MLRLVSYARHVIGHQRADAEELLHDAILTCHRRIEARGFTGEDDAMVGYLYQQIKHEYDCQRRSARRHPEHELPGQVPDHLEEVPAPAGPCPDAVHVFLHQHFSPADCELWEYHLQGVTLEEIGFLTGSTKSTVHRHLDKIREALRKEFRTWDEDQD
ncbi:RNA polymerase sigma factor [Hymenobacter pini]|uniref:RNA polymerase sigma factor n=1 Tax=Hymenobacter pini TaxID=2880879 RepID=UPI001CF368F2|nr:hypothetical protein [Hymenobacter pini]MCA8829448.1 hypothetical protein [Hymenobacter pini]